MSLKLNKLSVFKYSLALSCPIIPCLAMEEPDLSNKNPLYATKRLTASPAAELTNFPITRPRFTSAEELADIEIGQALIRDRIKQKQDLLAQLQNENTPLSLKQLYCQNDFGIVPLSRGSPNLEESIQEGIKSYCGYVSSFLEIYNAANSLTELVLNADSQAEKNKHQNDLYYLLSFNIKDFRERIAAVYTHQIPEHSLEDTFYEMIASKLCATATKEYAIVNDYLKLSLTSLGMRKQIDNFKILAHYKRKNKAIIDTFQRSHPVFWMGALGSEDIEKLADIQLNTIRRVLEECSTEDISILNDFEAKLGSYTESRTDHIGNVLHVYNEFGPYILRVIQRCEAVSANINQIVKESILWLKNFKDKNSKLFRKILTEQKGIINNYLTEQEQIARQAERISAAERTAVTAEIQAQKREKERLKREKKEQANAVAALIIRELAIAQLHAAPVESTKALTETSVSTAIDEEGIETPGNSDALASPYNTLKAAAVETGAFNKVISSTSAAPVPEELTTAPKIKLKSRPANNLLNADDEVQLKVKEIATPILPVQFRTSEFTSLVENLLSETNDRKLISLFKGLNESYGLESDTKVEKNKGYFSIRSPITDKIHVRTFHHLHKDYPYASIFMAVRQVLIAGNIIER